MKNTSHSVPSQHKGQKITYKYALKSVVLRMPNEDAKRLIPAFCKITGLTRKTYYNYCNIPLTSKRSIPSDVLDTLAMLLSVPVETLKNYKIEGKPVRQESITQTGLKY